MCAAYAKLLDVLNSGDLLIIESLSSPGDVVFLQIIYSAKIVLR